MQGLSILFGAALASAASLGCGALLLRGAVRDPAIRFIVGAAALSMAIFALCAVGLAYPAVFLLLAALAIAAGWRWRPAFGKAEVLHSHRVLTLFFLLFTILYFFSAMAPETSPDGAGYHLAFVADYLRWHGFRPITWTIYAALSQGMEMLFLFAYAFGRHSAAAMVHFAFLLALAWQILAYSRRAGYPLPGACAALLVYASPVVGVDGTSAYNDVAVAAAAFTLFHLLRIWDGDRNPRLLPAIGLVAGFGFAIKYTAWAGILYALGLVAWKSRRIRDVAAVAFPATLIASPWLIRNWFWFHNPVAPFFNNIFNNEFINYYFELGYRNDLALYDLPSRTRIPLEVTVHGGLGGLLGPVFLLAPIALLSLRLPEGRRLLLAALVFGCNYLSNIGTRFLIPPLPFVALAMMLALASFPRIAVGIAVLHAALSWPSIVTRYASPYAWRLYKVPYREALRLKSEDEYRRSHLIHDEVERMLDRTPEGSVIFTYRDIPQAYMSKRLLVGWESSQNQISGLMLQAAANPQLMPTWRLRLSFPRQSLYGVRLVQTAAADTLWKIHELRLFDGPRELPRDSRWRLTADPYPWGISDAFDNSLATMWRSGETLRPGMFVEVDFHREEQADTLLIETASDQRGLRLRLEGQGAAGAWRPIETRQETYDAPAPLGLRKAVAHELKLRGIDYVLAFEDENDTADLRRNPELWGVRIAGQTAEAKLFQLP